MGVPDAEDRGSFPPPHGSVKAAASIGRCPEVPQRLEGISRAERGGGDADAKEDRGDHIRGALLKGDASLFAVISIIIPVTVLVRVGLDDAVRVVKLVRRVLILPGALRVGAPRDRVLVLCLARAAPRRSVERVRIRPLPKARRLAAAAAGAIHAADATRLAHTRGVHVKRRVTYTLQTSRNLIADLLAAIGIFRLQGDDCDDAGGGAAARCPAPGIVLGIWTGAPAMQRPSDGTVRPCEATIVRA